VKRFGIKLAAFLMVCTTNAEAGSFRDQEPVYYSGILVQELTPELKDAFKANLEGGVLVNRVCPRSPADSAGVRQGDIVTRIGRFSIGGLEEFVEAMQSRNGDNPEIRISVYRNDSDKNTIFKFNRRVISTKPRACDSGSEQCASGDRTRENQPVEKFEEFLEKFSKNGDFQWSRIINPLQTETAGMISGDDSEEPKMETTEKTLSLESLLCDSRQVMPELGDYYEYFIEEISEAKREVSVQSQNSDVYVKSFVFERIGCCWFLARTSEIIY
jgi:hypothetical protein